MHRPSRWSTLLGLAAVVSTFLVAGLLSASPGRAGADTPTTLPASASPVAGSARWSGADALARLGDRLPAVAETYGWTVAELRTKFDTDPTLFVDAKDALLYVDTAPTAAAATIPSPLDTTISDADTFLLHSRPGASRTIYLDFDGQLLSGTAWNSSTGGDCFAGPFDAESPANPAFSTAELEIIKSVWKRVAEDYAPLDVDVTTQDPGTAAIDRTTSSDLVYGTRALITNSTSPCPNGKTLYASVCANGCGGIAYVGVFDSTGTSHDYYQPALVFQNGVGTNAKYIAEAASHEVGHNGGLSHDGTTSGCGTGGTSACGYYQGQGSWAPIMGVGYYEAITQWSKGEYSLANNKEDDFVVLGSNGLPVRADDVGGTAATATVLSTPTATVQGVISTRTDVDAYSVSVGAGSATFSVTPVPSGPDLDLRLEVRDATGALVASADPASGSTGYDSPTGLGASVTATLPAGTYTVLVDGVGAGDALTTGYSDYASTGYYTLTSSVVVSGDAAPTAVATATPTSGTAPLLVSFVGSGSTDPEGGALTYAWTFGDGGTSSAADPTYTYATAGNWIATLTVTDPLGQSGSASMTINVTAPVRRIDVAALAVSGSRQSRTSVSANASVTVKDAASAPVASATVTGTWSLGAKLLSTKSATTSTSGTVSISTGGVKASAGQLLTFCVTNVALTGGTWDRTLFPPNTAPDCASWTVV